MGLSLSFYSSIHPPTHPPTHSTAHVLYWGSKDLANFILKETNKGEEEEEEEEEEGARVEG